MYNSQCAFTFTIDNTKGYIDSKEKRACNLVPIKIQTEAKISNKLYISYGIKAAKVTKNDAVLYTAI